MFFGLKHVIRAVLKTMMNLQPKYFGQTLTIQNQQFIDKKHKSMFESFNNNEYNKFDTNNHSK